MLRKPDGFHAGRKPNAKRGATRPAEAPANGQGELSIRHRGNSHLLCRVPRLIARSRQKPYDESHRLIHPSRKNTLG